MNDKKRLEEIEQLLNDYYNTEDGFEQNDLSMSIIQNHVGWLIKQAEQLHGRKGHYGYKKMYGKCNSDYAQLHEQNKRYRRELKNALYFVKHSTHERDKQRIMQESIEKALEVVGDE